MKEYKNKYLKIYLGMLASLVVLYIISRKLLPESKYIDLVFLVDMIITITLVVALFYFGNMPCEIEGEFMRFCEFEVKHDREKVDVIHTYIVTIPTFIYIILVYLKREGLPRILMTFTSLSIVIIISSFIGFRICYKNKDFIKEEQIKKPLT